jgi:hypothetical protein
MTKASRGLRDERQFILLESVCMFVCERERETDRERQTERERISERTCECCVNVCVCV